MATGWKIDSLDLRTLAHNVSDASGWDGFPKKRSGNREIAYRDGEFSNPRKWFGPKELLLNVVLLDTNASGVVVSSRAQHLRENLDALLGALYKRNGFLDVRKTVAFSGGTHERSAMCEVIDAIEVSESFGLVREMALRFRMVEGLWRQIETAGADAPQKSVALTGITGTSQAVNVVTGGNAPVRGGLAGALEIEFEANSDIINPRFETDVQGEFVQYSGTLSAGESFVIDIGQQQAVIDGTTRADSGMLSGNAWMIDFDPDTTTACTATVSSASNYDLTVRWYDRWL